MAKFGYRDKNAGGNISGSSQAASLAGAAQTLGQQGMSAQGAVPSGLQNVLAALRSVNIQRGPGLKDVYNFTNQLAVMIKAGIDIRSAIKGIAEQVENPKFRKMLEHVATDVEAGQPLSDTLAKYTNTFGALYINMTKASELSGNFGNMLERTASYLSQQIETRRMVRGAMIYPIIIGVMAVVTTVFMLTFVLPKFTSLFAGKDALLPKPTVILMSISVVMRTYWHMLIGGLVAGIVAFQRIIRTSIGRQYWDTFKLRVPLFKRMFRALYITRSMQTMGELVNAGVPMLEVLRITSEISGNYVYRRLWLQVQDAVREGGRIAEQLVGQPLLPKNVVQMISAGEESGKLGTVLQDVSEYYAKELNSTIKAVTSMIEPLMIIIMGVVVGFIAMSVVLPIFKLSSLVKQ